MSHKPPNSLSDTDSDGLRNAWGQIAEKYDRFVTPTHMWVAGEGLRRAAVGRGTGLLDVAAGSGALSITAARLGAQVLAVDISPDMLRLLQRRADAEELSAIKTQVMDGHALQLPDGAFDVAASQYGVMLFPDLTLALREMARVTRPGGRVLLTVFGPPEEIEFETFFYTAMQAVLPDFQYLPADPVPLPFQAADPTRLQQLLEQAALSEIRIETITETLQFRSGDEFWNWSIYSHPIGTEVLAQMTESQQDAVRTELDTLVRERAADKDYAILAHPVHIAVATK